VNRRPLTWVPDVTLARLRAGGRRCNGRVGISFPASARSPQRRAPGQDDGKNCGSPRDRAFWRVIARVTLGHDGSPFRGMGAAAGPADGAGQGRAGRDSIHGNRARSSRVAIVSTAPARPLLLVPL
jgi:hypothetical protein